VGDVANNARNHWYGILTELGIGEEYLTGKHCPCPACGGEDRFRFDDKDGRGDYFCSGCGAGDGFSLLMKVRGWDFFTAAKEVEAILGIVPEKRPEPKPDPTIRLRKIQAELVDITKDSPVAMYLKGRGISSGSKRLKMNPVMRYYHDKDTFDEFPAMVAKVFDNDGNPVAFHVTYLSSNGTETKKAPVKNVKKVIGELGENGYAVRLFRPRDYHLGVAEGIETSLAARQLTGIPTWATLSANGLRDFRPPEGVTKVTIFADNDLNFAGQAAAYELANKLSILKYRVRVVIPAKPGYDWLDVLLYGNDA